MILLFIAAGYYGRFLGPADLFASTSSPHQPESLSRRVGGISKLSNSLIMMSPTIEETEEEAKENRGITPC
jgi:hypothetical protein